MTVAITGIGLITAAGVGVERAFERMCEGAAAGAGRIPDFEPKLFLGERGIRHFDRTSLLLASAAALALEGSGPLDGTYAPHEIGVVMGETHGSIQAIAEFDQEALREGPKYVNPQAFCNTVINAPASRLSIRHGVTGLNSTLSSGAASALDACAQAVAALRAGRVRVAVCGSALGYSAEVAWGYRRARRLHGGGRQSAPFAAGRRGAALGEGAAVFVLEDEAQAHARGARPIARIAGSGAGFAVACDTRGSGVALATAARRALQTAGARPEHVSAAVCSASGDPAGDLEEGAALGLVFGSLETPLPITAPKSATAECLETSGAIGIAVAARALETGRIPPIAGLGAVDPAFADLDLVRSEARSRRLEHVLVTARDDAGHCAALLVSAP